MLHAILFCPVVCGPLLFLLHSLPLCVQALCVRFSLASLTATVSAAADSFSCSLSAVIFLCSSTLCSTDCILSVAAFSLSLALRSSALATFAASPLSFVFIAASSAAN